jgi:CRISPR system Cascade subunit CasD
MDILLFRVYGNMASWGEIAVGESRHTANYPSKSAVLGLLAAALGIERDDETQQQALQLGYAIAIEVFSSGNILRDYHTTQAPDSVGKFRYRTRRDELIIGKERLGTTLSSRDYRTDALAVIAVKALANTPFSLATLQEKLKKPVFHLYLGRKSCPLAAPLNPQILENQPNLLTAFNAYQHLPLLPTSKPFPERDNIWLGLDGNRQYYWEGELTDLSDNVDMHKIQTRIRHDQPLSRQRWQFTPRQEHYFYQGAE